MTIDELLFKLGIEADTSKLKEFAGMLAKVENSNAEGVIDAVSGAAASLGIYADAASDKVESLNNELDKAGAAAKKSGDISVKAADNTGKAFGKAKSEITKFRGVFMFFIGAAAAMSIGVVRGLNGMLAKVDEYAKSKNKLYDITKGEVKQAKEYTKGIERTGQLMDSLKARVALGLLPTLGSLSQGFNDLLINNKELISEGLTAFFKTIVTIVRVVFNFIGAINNVIKNTIGWKVALLALVVVLGIVKKATLLAFATNPLTWIILGIVAVIAILDDLIHYLNGGKSAFGAFWGPAIKWAKAAWKIFGDTMAAIAGFFDDLAGTVNRWFDDLGEVFGKVYDIIVSPFKAAFDFVMNLFKKTIGAISGGISGIGKLLGFDVGGASGAGAANPASAAVGAQTNNSQTVSHRGGDVRADITVISPDPSQAGNKVKDALAPAYARANQNMQGSRAY